MKQLSQSFFAADTVTIAQKLLGKIIKLPGCSVRIVETEAYTMDAASHAFRKTPRSALMYTTYGHIYVYLIYGMYSCLNFTTEKNGVGAVLIRAAEPLTGIDIMKRQRKVDDLRKLCSGPGKLCQALQIKKEYNGSMVGEILKLYDDQCKVEHIGRSSRIGINAAQDLEWRFFIKGNRYVSIA